MSRMHNAVLPVALLLSALVLSACATKPKEQSVTAPAQVPAAVEQKAAEPTPAPAAEQAAPAPSVKAEAPAPKPVAKKHKKKVAKAAPPKAVEPEPVVAPPAPVVKEEAPAVMQPEPMPAKAPTPPVAEKGFLEQYWLWLVGIVVAAVAVFLVTKKKD